MQILSKIRFLIFVLSLISSSICLAPPKPVSICAACGGSGWRTDDPFSLGLGAHLCQHCPGPMTDVSRLSACSAAEEKNPNASTPSYTESRRVFTGSNAGK